METYAGRMSRLVGDRLGGDWTYEDIESWIDRWIRDAVRVDWQVVFHFPDGSTIVIGDRLESPTVAKDVLGLSDRRRKKGGRP